jgi:catechol 2,3-dioxygenase-like lactoylglutathione lyase family enzyme
MSPILASQSEMSISGRKTAMEHIIARLLEEFEHGRMTRRQLIQSLALTATAASAGSAAAASPVAEAVSINHVSYQVADYTKTRDFYSGLFGMKVSRDNGMECRLRFGDNILIARNRPSGTPRVDHIAYTLANWDTDKKVKGAVEAELKRRGLKVRTTEPSAENRRFGEEPSFIVEDPDGFMVQMGGKEQ